MFELSCRSTCYFSQSVDSRKIYQLCCKSLECNIKLFHRMFENVPKLMVPMLWFTQRATLTPELANQAKVGSYLNSPFQLILNCSFLLQLALMLPGLGIYVAIFFGTIGIILTGVFGYIYVRRWSRQVPYEELLRWSLDEPTAIEPEADWSRCDGGFKCLPVIKGRLTEGNN